MGVKLTTHDMRALDDACVAIRTAFPEALSRVYLVGTAESGAKPYRDVDVRLILSDERFDALFAPPREENVEPKSHCPDCDQRCGFLHLRLWELLSLSIGAFLRERTGLPIDFQIQRMSDANERHSRENGGTSRNPLGLAQHGARHFAGMGDGTPFAKHGYWDPTA